MISAAIAGASPLGDGDFNRPGLTLAQRPSPGQWNPVVHRPGEGRFAVASNAGRNGTAAVQFIKTDTILQNAHLDQVVAVPTNAIIEVTAWARGDGKSANAFMITQVDWRPLATGVAPADADWSRISVAFHSGTNSQVRLSWHPAITEGIHRSGPGSHFLDDVTIAHIARPPEDLRRALELVHRPADIEIAPRPAKTPIGTAGTIRPISCRDGVLIYPDGSEVALWGVNFQTPLAWEYNGRLRQAGVPLTAEALKKVSDANLREIRFLGANVIRMHLCPSDFSDADGNVRDSVYLDVLDHLMAAARKSGMYVYLTIINDMGQKTFGDSFIVDCDRSGWVTEPEFVDKTERFIRQFLSRESRYTGRRYADDPCLAVIEIMNEPGYPDWPDIMAEKQPSRSHDAFREWRKRRGSSVAPEADFYLWRHDAVTAYLARICGAIRSSGSKHPIIWNLNWPGFIKQREDIFDAVAESPVDGVSFCLYPGQQDTKHPFWAHPVNLDDKNYLPFLAAQYRDYDRLRWLLGRRFAKKAKLVYEFETFYSQNSFLYPAMARLFRALGAQIATMWTYSLTPSAEFLSGSHHLNLYCTPQKAASFAIASEVFCRSARLEPYPAGGADELALPGFSASATRNISVLHSGDTIMHSRPLDRLPAQATRKPGRILAVGGSPLVTYDGTGIYCATITDDAIDLSINPDAAFVLPHWQKQARPWSKTCRLDWDARHRFAIDIEGWVGKISVSRLEGDSSTPIENRGPKPDFDATPGRYLIRKQ